MWSVTGHDSAVSYFRHAVANNKLGHAYLISGRRQLGKKTLAIALAQSLKCRKKDSPCGVCETCARISSLKHPDVHFVALGTGSHSEDARLATEISIKQIREDIQHWSSLPAFEDGARVFIIDDVEFLSTEASNSLLKTLEEPTNGVFFVLLSCQHELLPETVVSRCQCLELKPVAIGKIRDALIEKGVPEEKASLLGRLSRGCPGWAFAVASDDSVLVNRSRDINKWIEVLCGTINERFEYSATLSTRFTQSRAEVFALLALLLDMWRDFVLLIAGQDYGLTNIDFVDEMRLLVGSMTLGDVRRGINAVIFATTCLRRNANPKLALDVLMLDMPVVRNVPACA